MDTDALKYSWEQVAKSGDEVPLYFYSHLFLSHPELRAMFPITMSQQRDRLVGALGQIVSRVDQLDEVTAFIQQLGRDHRRFSVVPEHYNAVGASLLATLKQFLGAAWTEELAADWAAAYGVIARVMVEAAEDVIRHEPRLVGRRSRLHRAPNDGRHRRPDPPTGNRTTTLPGSRSRWRSRNGLVCGATSAQPTPRGRTARSSCTCSWSTVAR